MNELLSASSAQLIADKIIDWYRLLRSFLKTVYTKITNYFSAASIALSIISLICGQPQLATLAPKYNQCGNQGDMDRVRRWKGLLKRVTPKTVCYA